MDSEILLSEREHHRRWRWLYRTLTIGFIGILAAIIIYQGFKASLRHGLILTGSIAAIAIAITAITMITNRPVKNALATSGPWSFGQVYCTAENQKIWNSMGRVVVSHSMTFKRIAKQTALCERPGSLLFRKGIHLLDVQPSSEFPGWTVVTVFSCPDLPTTLTDFGRGTEINTLLLSAVPDFKRYAEVAELEASDE